VAFVLFVLMVVVTQAMNRLGRGTEEAASA
jgi:hypothetical protein